MEDLDGLASVAETSVPLREALSTAASWQALRATLTFGGFCRREFCTPYFYSTYSASPMSGVPAGEGDIWIVTNNTVPVRAAPNQDAELFGTFEYDVIRVSGLSSPSGISPAWREVFIPDGRRAWVEASQIRSLGDYHAVSSTRAGGGACPPFRVVVSRRDRTTDGTRDCRDQQLASLSL
jgi:hypothetical protein